jgi:hypothetical protein
VCRGIEAENPGHSQVVEAASITEASSGGDLGDSNTVIEQTQIGGSSPQYLVITNGRDNPKDAQCNDDDQATSDQVCRSSFAMSAATRSGRSQFGQ